MNSSKGCPVEDSFGQLVVSVGGVFRHILRPPKFPRPILLSQMYPMASSHLPALSSWPPSRPVAPHKSSDGFIDGYEERKNLNSFLAIHERHVCGDVKIGRWHLLQWPR